jgi:hypothetical protein
MGIKASPSFHFDEIVIIADLEKRVLPHENDHFKVIIIKK